MSEAIFTQRFSADNFPLKGTSNSDGGPGASSNFRYTFVDSDARVLTYFTCLSCTLVSIGRVLRPERVKRDQLFSKSSAVFRRQLNSDPRIETNARFC